MRVPQDIARGLPKRMRKPMEARGLAAVSWLLLLAGASTSVQAVADPDGILSVSHKEVSPTASAWNASWVADRGKISSTAIASLDPDSSAFVRLESAWVHDLEDSSARIRVGDSTSNPGAWGSAVRFAGIQFGTPFEARSDVMSAPRLALSGLAVVPTAVDALFDAAGRRDTLVSERGLSLEAMPVMGANGLSFKARDALGHTTAFTGPLIARPIIPEAGCKQFSMSVGRVREDYALVGERYGQVFANTTMVCGAGPGLAIEAHGEYLQGEAGIAGLNLSRPFGAQSAASVAIATSDNETGNGWSVRVGLNHGGDRFRVDLRARLQTAAYRDLGVDAESDPVAERVLASITARLGDRGKLGIAYGTQKTFALERTDIVAMTQTVDLGTAGTVSVVANSATHDSRSAAVNLSFARALDF